MNSLLAFIYLRWLIESNGSVVVNCSYLILIALSTKVWCGELKKQHHVNFSN